MPAPPASQLTVSRRRSLRIGQGWETGRARLDATDQVMLV